MSTAAPSGPLRCTSARSWECGARSPHAEEAFVGAWRAAAQRHLAAFLRGDISFQEGRRRVRELLEADVAAALGEAEVDGEQPVYLEAYRANWRLFDDVTACLKALRPYQLGVISNGAQAQGLEKLTQLGILPHFAFVLSAEAAGCAKTDPTIFRQTQARSSCATSSCIYIGDQLETDVEAAARAGWRSGWVGPQGSAARRPRAHPNLAPGVSGVARAGVFRAVTTRPPEAAPNVRPPPSRYHEHMIPSRRILTALALALALAACTPRTDTPAAPTTPTTPAAPAPEEPERERRVLTDPAALEADRAAREAFHLMGLAYLETGSYSAEVLLRELNLPPGVLWAIQEISETSYTLQLTSDSVPGVAWTVTPEGVVARAVADNRIY